MKRLLIIPLLAFFSLAYSQEEATEEKSDIDKTKSQEAEFAGKIVEIDPLNSDEEEELWKFDKDGVATSLYEKKKKHWKIKGNILFIGNKKYFLSETAFVDPE